MGTHTRLFMSTDAGAPVFAATVHAPVSAVDLAPPECLWRAATTWVAFSFGEHTSLEQEQILESKLGYSGQHVQLQHEVSHANGMIWRSPAAPLVCGVSAQDNGIASWWVTVPAGDPCALAVALADQTIVVDL